MPRKNLFARQAAFNKPRNMVRAIGKAMSGNKLTSREGLATEPDKPARMPRVSDLFGLSSEPEISALVPAVVVDAVDAE